MVHDVKLGLVTFNSTVSAIVVQKIHCIKSLFKIFRDSLKIMFSANKSNGYICNKILVVSKGYNKKCWKFNVVCLHILTLLSNTEN